MWSALRADLKEFVSTVTTDTSSALNRMDDNFPDVSLSPEEQEAIRRMKLEETYTSPLQIADEEEEDDEDEERKKALEEYLANFQIDEKTQDISAELEKYPDSLQPMFERLVPTTVSYNDFWQRYFYRCDVERIQDEWAAAEERERHERAQAVTHSLQGVRTFLGGAVQVVSKTLTEVDKDQDGDDAEKQVGVSPFLGSTAAANAKGGFFNSVGRPPFVSNTAVDEEDDDDDNEARTEDDEEELGWDDEDEEDEGGDEDEGNDEEEEEHIEFKDVATEKLQEQLKTALEERDMLHQTVEMQTKEIASLKAAGLTGDAPEDIKKLQMQLFEKESELAAMKAAHLDISRDQSMSDAAVVTTLEQEKTELQETLAAKESELNEMETLLANMMEQLKQMTATSEADKSSLKQALEKNAELETKIGSQNEDVSANNAELSAEISALKGENESLQQKLSSAEEQLAASKAQIASLATNVDDLKAKLSESQKQVDLLTSELATTKSALEEQQAHAATLEEAATGQSHASPDTISTGVRIDHDEEPPVKKVPGDDEEEDWGDDW